MPVALGLAVPVSEEEGVPVVLGLAVPVVEEEGVPVALGLAVPAREEDGVPVELELGVSVREEEGVPVALELALELAVVELSGVGATVFVAKAKAEFKAHRAIAIFNKLHVMMALSLSELQEQSK